MVTPLKYSKLFIVQGMVNGFRSDGILRMRSVCRGKLPPFGRDGKQTCTPLTLFAAAQCPVSKNLTGVPVAKISPQAEASQMFIPDTLAEVQVTYSSRIAVKDRFKISCSSDVAKAFRQFWPSFERVEYFYILLLNRANHVLGYHQVSKGGVAGTVVDQKIIFQVALKCNASGIILAHNHPSGNTSPSKSDEEITQKVKEIGRLLEIPVLDHLILNESEYLSFADEGIM